MGAPFANALLPDHPFVAFMGVVNIAFLIGVPILSLALLAGRWVFSIKYNVRWNKSLWLLWALNIVSLFGVGSYIMSHFSVGKTLDISAQEINMTQDVLTVHATENPYKDAWIRIGDLDIAGNVLASTNISIEIEKATGEQFQISTQHKSRGKTLEDAIQSANIVRHNLDVVDNKISLDPYFAIQEGEKWRNQKIILQLFIPEGKSVRFDNLPWNIRRHIRSTNSGDYKYHSIKNGQIWTMTADGFRKK